MASNCGQETVADAPYLPAPLSQPQNGQPAVLTRRLILPTRIVAYGNMTHQAAVVSARSIARAHTSHALMTLRVSAAAWQTPSGK